MAQKTNPIILRVGLNKTWDTSLFEKKNSELPNYTYKDSEIKIFVKQFLENNGLILKDFKADYSESFLNVFVSYFVNNKFVSEKKKINTITLVNKKNNGEGLTLKFNQGFITARPVKKNKSCYEKLKKIKSINKNLHEKVKSLISREELKRNLKKDNITTFWELKRKYSSSVKSLQFSTILLNHIRKTLKKATKIRISSLFYEMKKVTKNKEYVESNKKMQITTSSVKGTKLSENSIKEMAFTYYETCQFLERNDYKTPVYVIDDLNKVYSFVEKIKRRGKGLVHKINKDQKFEEFVNLTDAAYLLSIKKNTFLAEKLTTKELTDLLFKKIKEKSKDPVYRVIPDKKVIFGTEKVDLVMWENSIRKIQEERTKEILSTKKKKNNRDKRLFNKFKKFQSLIFYLISKKKIVKFLKRYSKKKPVVVNMNSFINKQTIKDAIETSSINQLMKSLNLFTKNQYKIKTTFVCLNKQNFIFTKKQTNSFRRKLMNLRKFKNSSFFNEGISVIFATLSNKDNSSEILAKFIAQHIKTIKRHRFFISFLKKSLMQLLETEFSNVKGVRIKISGRLNSRPKAKHKILKLGSLPIQTLNSNVSYTQTVIHNNNGSFGIKVWVVAKINKKCFYNLKK